ncbi:MAG: MucR family transcriptional regulator [Rhodospirillaceae bacterium]
METAHRSELIELTSKIVAAYVSRNVLQPSDLPTLINAIHQSLKTAGQPPQPVDAVVDLKPAVPIKKSVFPDYIVCLEDGKKLKMLKRHLASSYGLTPDEYRSKWGLPSDYPMVAPNYAKARSDLALKLGLGRRPG